MRRASESARASLLASEQGRRTVVLTIVTTVASGYIQLRALDRQLEIAQHTSQSLGEAARLQRVRSTKVPSPKAITAGRIAVPGGRGPGARARASDRAAGKLHQRAARSQSRPDSPGAGHRRPALPGGAWRVAGIAAGRRPDILQAEENLIAANADIGVAKAAYFPDISLTGVFGLESAQLSNLFKGPSQAWSYGGSLLQPIFNAGRISGQVARAEAIQQQALYTYEKSIISAFQDVENALIDRTKYGQVREEQAKNVLALFSFRDLAVLRYNEGATIYLEVASAEQSLFFAQLAYVTTQFQLFQSYANLYKAMGGGWVDEAEKMVGNGAAGNKSDE